MANIFTPDWIPESYRENFIDQANLILSEFPTITPEALNYHWERFSVGNKWIADHDKNYRDFTSELRNESQVKALFDKGKAVDIKMKLTAGETDVWIKSERLKNLIINHIRKELYQQKIEFVSNQEPKSRLNPDKHNVLFHSLCHHAIFTYYHLPESSMNQKHYLIGLLMTMNGFNKPVNDFDNSKGESYRETLIKHIRSVIKRDMAKYYPDIAETIKTHLKDFQFFYPEMEPEKQLHSFWGVSI